MVPEFERFIELANKTSPGYATKPGSIGKAFQRPLDYVDAYFEAKNGYTMLPKARVKSAIKVPNQWRSWSCGPNSGLRALHLLGATTYDYDSFIDCCPKTICKDTTIKKGSNSMFAGIGLTALGLVFAPITGGASLLPGAAFTVGGAATAVTGGVISSDVGPKPAGLADYLTRCMKRFRAKHNTENSAASIAKDIDWGYPRIVLFVMETDAAHYMNVIGYKKNKQGIEGFVLLDTNGEVGYMTAKDLDYWQCNTCIPFLGSVYNSIEFFKK